MGCTDQTWVVRAVGKAFYLANHLLMAPHLWEGRVAKVLSEDKNHIPRPGQTMQQLMCVILGALGVILVVMGLTDVFWDKENKTKQKNLFSYYDWLLWECDLWREDLVKNLIRLLMRAKPSKVQGYHQSMYLWRYMKSIPVPVSSQKTKECPSITRKTGYLKLQRVVKFRCQKETWVVSNYWQKS